MKSVPAWKWFVFSGEETGPKADLCSPGGDEREQNNDAESSGGSG